MRDRKQHQKEVLVFLQDIFHTRQWELVLPQGTGNETYFAHGNDHIYFIKLSVDIARYQVMDSIGLIPHVLVTGYLDDRTSVVVQSYIEGRNPSRRDYCVHLEQIAKAIDRMHLSPEMQQVLPQVSSDLYSVAAAKSLSSIQERWIRFKAQVPEVAEFVDESLTYLNDQVRCFEGKGLVASHNDICNSNWLISPDGQLYLLDLESMSLDDPAFDIGAILWWYYPPELRSRFLEIGGHANDESFQFRMQVRMAMHCLGITLPRDESYDQFDPASFTERLVDFRAIMAGKENPQGYDV